MSEFNIQEINNYFKELLNLIPSAVKNQQQRTDLIESTKDLPHDIKRNNQRQQKRAKMNASIQTKEVAESISADDELRHKLHEKIATFQKERHAEKTTKKEHKPKKEAKKPAQKPSKASVELVATPNNGKSTIKTAIAKKSASENAIVGNISFASNDKMKKAKKRTPEQLLQLAMSRDHTLKSLDAQKQAEIAEKESWRKAILLAKGETVKDDIKLLKKTVKKKEKKKAKTAAEWANRTSKVKKEQNERSKKRNENIKEKIQARKNKKMGIKKPKTKVKSSAKKHK